MSQKLRHVFLTSKCQKLAPQTACGPPKPYHETRKDHKKSNRETRQILLGAGVLLVAVRAEDARGVDEFPMFLVSASTNRESFST